MCDLASEGRVLLFLVSTHTCSLSLNGTSATLSALSSLLLPFPLDYYAVQFISSRIKALWEPGYVMAFVVRSSFDGGVKKHLL